MGDAPADAAPGSGTEHGSARPDCPAGVDPASGWVSVGMTTGIFQVEAFAKVRWLSRHRLAGARLSHPSFRDGILLPWDYTGGTVVPSSPPKLIHTALPG